MITRRDEKFLLTFWDASYPTYRYEWFESVNGMDRYIKNNNIKNEDILDKLEVHDCTKLSR